MLIVYFITYASSTFNHFWGVSDSQNKQLNSSNWKKKKKSRSQTNKKRQGQERKQWKLSGKIAQCLLHCSCSTESALKQNLNANFNVNEYTMNVIFMLHSTNRSYASTVYWLGRLLGTYSVLKRLRVQGRTDQGAARHLLGPIQFIRTPLRSFVYALPLAALMLSDKTVCWDVWLT